MILFIYRNINIILNYATYLDERTIDYIFSYNSILYEKKREN
jgi:hypothetical protein